jgi:hypothetical protein
MKTSHATALAAAIILALSAVPVGAASNRTFVSGVGNDGNPCSRTQPCASFSAALASTNAGGEIDCLDPGDFGIVTISQSVSIICDGVSNGGIVSTGANESIFVDAPNGSVVYLSGLNLDGANIGSYGVVVESGSTVYIINSTIRSFSGQGVAVSSNTNSTRVIIKDSIIVNNGSPGQNITGGVSVEGQDGATNTAIILNTVIDDNTNYAARASTNSAIALVQTLLTASTTGLNLLNGGSAVLIGPSNTIVGAISGPTTSVPFK